MRIRKRYAAGLVLGLLALARYGTQWLDPYIDRFVDRNFTFPSPLLPSEAARQLAALRDKPGYGTRAVRVWLDKDGIIVDVPDPKLPETTNQWRVYHFQLLQRFDWFPVSGPEAVQTQTLPSVRQRLFDLTRIDFGLVPGIVQAAIKRAGLRETAAASSLVLSNESRSNPSETGPLRWTVTVESPHEKAEIYADAAGQLTGADLSQTLRARTLDLFRGGQPLHDMAQAIGNRFVGEQIDSVTVDSTEIQVAPASTDPTAQEDPIYVSNINGIHRAPFGVNRPYYPPPVPGLPRIVPKYQPFAVRDIDWSALPRLLDRARELAGMPDARVLDIEIQKRTSCLPPPALEWTVNLGPQSGKDRAIALDTAGNAPAC
jgi:hypothetical protein